MRTLLLTAISVSIYLVSCVSPSSDAIPEKVEGYVPVYSKDEQSLKQITADAPRQIVRGGKIYTTGTLLFQVEQDSGIHIIDYSNPQNPQKIAFIKSFLCKEVSVKNGFIYTNNLDDLVVIDANNITNIKVIGREKHVFPDLLTQSPPKANFNDKLYFECPDASKGIVIGWEKQIIYKPKCWK